MSLLTPEAVSPAREPARSGESLAADHGYRLVGAAGAAGSLREAELALECRAPSVVGFASGSVAGSSVSGSSVVGFVSGSVSGSRSAVARAAWHALAWLALANLVGVWLGALLLFPGLGSALAPYSYGRWMPVHLNLQLYGWLSLPLVAWLLRLYRADALPQAWAARAGVTLWSLALCAGAASWLGGGAGGKLFLDWTGFSRVFFPAAIAFLWAVLLAAFLHARPRDTHAASAAKAVGLALLALVPPMIYIASDPSLYPPINPDSGGPTGASQLESVLVIVLILFVLPYGLAERNAAGSRRLKACWGVFAVEALLCLGLGRADVSHHRPTQWISLGSLLLWVPLIPAYWSAFHWMPSTRAWRWAAFTWWALLVPTGWCLFLPGVLDRFKFTDGLVAHSLLAMAGFTTNLLLLLLAVLLGKDGDTLDSKWAFATWQGCALLYVAVMLTSGWIEGSQPGFTMTGSPLREALYTARLMLGAGMAAASLNWLLRLSFRMRMPA